MEMRVVKLRRRRSSTLQVKYCLLSTRQQSPFHFSPSPPLTLIYLYPIRYCTSAVRLPIPARCCRPVSGDIAEHGLARHLLPGGGNHWAQPCKTLINQRLCQSLSTSLLDNCSPHTQRALAPTTSRHHERHEHEHGWHVHPYQQSHRP
jgi:hypothetical protein